MIRSKRICLLMIVILYGLFSIDVFSQQNITDSDYLNKNELPADFTPINIDVLNEPTADGYLFFAFLGAWGFFPEAIPYLVITDNHATPIFYWKTEINVFDFKVQPNGILSFARGFGSNNYLMNDKFELIGDVRVNGHVTDFHDFHILDNGNYLFLGSEYRIVDMDTVVPGGHPGVTVLGAFIEIQDSSGQRLWSWTSFDHFKITDAADYQVDLTSSDYIDYVHANALEMDSDTSILMSCRNMDEITKINMNTGEIMWRLGGENNEFTVSNDTAGFYMQHDIRRLANGHFQIFDNGTQHIRDYSSIVQYDLDEENKTAVLVRRIISSPEVIFGGIMGSAQELPNGNTLVGWGSGVPNITEFKPDDSKALEFSFEATSYRAFRFQFEPMAFTFDTNYLDFGYIHPLDSSEKHLQITNNLTEAISINRLLSRTGKYYAGNSSLIIQPGNTEQFLLKYKPGEEGSFNDVLTICYDVDDQNMTRRIAKQINVTGIASNDAGIEEYKDYAFSVYPNPVIKNCNINFSGQTPEKLIVYDILGQIVKEITITQKSNFIDFQDLQSGIYIISSYYEMHMIVNKKVIKK